MEGKGGEKAEIEMERSVGEVEVEVREGLIKMTEADSKK